MAGCVRELRARREGVSIHSLHKAVYYGRVFGHDPWRNVPNTVMSWTGGGTHSFMFRRESFKTLTLSLPSFWTRAITHTSSGIVCVFFVFASITTAVVWKRSEQPGTICFFVFNIVECGNVYDSFVHPNCRGAP